METIPRGRFKCSPERDSFNPGDETDEGEDGEEQEYNSSRVILPREHVYSGHETEDDVENASNPDELFREDPSKGNITPAQNQRYKANEREEHHGVGVEAECVLIVVNAAAIEPVERDVALQ